MTLSVPTRHGPRPTTHYAIPHHQLDQTTPPHVYARLVERFVALPDTTNGPSLVSVLGSCALFLADDGACNDRAFFKDREFAHVHPPDDGSFHMILSEADCEAVLASGWGELHPFAVTGKIQKTAVMIFAPRDEAEVETVLAITRAAQRYAMTPVQESRE